MHTVATLWTLRQCCPFVTPVIELKGIPENSITLSTGCMQYYSSDPFSSMELGCQTRHNPWTGMVLYLVESNHVFLILDIPFKSVKFPQSMVVGIWFGWGIMGNNTFFPVHQFSICLHTWRFIWCLMSKAYTLSILLRFMRSGGPKRENWPSVYLEPIKHPL